ncbi:transcription factor TFIIIC subunit tfc4 [Lambiella insularis]|nr:transcription factor TFIIIC subunit tfc4 [Lambiella insularis]
MDSDQEARDMLRQSNEYPDPDYTPRFLWLGSRNITTLPEGNDDEYDRDGLITPESYLPYTESQHNIPVAELAEIRNSKRPSVDPDFEFQEEDERSDELSSEVASDSEASNPPNTEKRGRGRRRGTRRGRASRGNRGTRGLGSSRGRGRNRLQKGLGRGGKGIKRGVRKPLEPSLEFKSLHSQATLSFIEQDYVAAEKLTLQAIQCNSEIFTAYSLLSEIHMAGNDKKRAMVALFIGAHTRPRDTVLWCHVAKLIMEVAGDDRISNIPEAIYCYNRVIGADAGHIEARYERAALHREFGNLRRAAHDYVFLLRTVPHDPTVLRHLAEIYIDLDECARAIEHYDTSIEHFQLSELTNATAFTWSDLNIYAELYMYSTDLVEVARGIAKVKNVSRWLLNRGDDRFWDQLNGDDREFDAADFPRRIALPDFVCGQHNTSTYGEGLPLEIRVKLGLLRLKLGNDHFAEAIAHLEWLEPHITGRKGKAFDYPDLFREAADTLRLRGLWHEALRFYDPLQQIEEHADSSYFNDMGLCYRALGLYDEAENCFRVIVDNDNCNTDALLKLATMFENAHLPERAAQYVDKIIALKRERAPNQQSVQRSSGSTLSLRSEPLGPSMSSPRQAMLHPRPARKPARVPAAQRLSSRQISRAQTQERIQLHYLELRAFREQYENGASGAKAEWMETAKVLIDDFRRKKAFFPARTDRWTKPSGHGRIMGTRTNQVIGDSNATSYVPDLMGDDDEDDDSKSQDYCGISFEKWLDVFLEYALNAAESGDTKQGCDIAATAAEANVFFHSREFMFSIHVIWFMCALLAEDDDTLCNVARFFMKDYQFVSDSYHLFATLNRLCNRSNIWYNNGPTQKYILRQIKAVDFSLMGEERLKSYYQEKASYTTKDEAGQYIHAEGMDIALIMMYGFILYTGGSQIYALSKTLESLLTLLSVNYFFRAYALEPGNPMVNLSLALSYMHYAIKRQSENRHYNLMQGFSFLFAYYDIRKVSEVAIERQECEFNVGRAYQMLGLTHLAIPFYERCLDLNEEVQRICGGGAMEDYALEAAYTLQGIWAASGEMHLAQKITEKYLVI